ncbi:sporulation protein YtfJ [Cerasibacillus quisquiliarum]|uniref:Putative spore protein YtfJ n=1 Tax=Cerasibacillus quisquiliarum TaxID=227865 RepID=A0A511V031_9BACI|nr:GerW family sporulation protein [Cerasibacillus quisquiliarum]MBB5147376.1 sporulation protein YtfJ [Cerasibacillus quisquiliarum]GEN32264.1 putative spore protein YtfJ [Cerasibacillus quisquiliarum]
MEEHPIQSLMATTMENLKEMIDVNTIIGEPVEAADETLIIPISKLGFGFASGGSEFSQYEQSSEDAMLPFGGGAGGGVSVTPIAFLIVHKKGVKIIHLDENVHVYEKLLDLAPQALEKVEHILSDLLRNNRKSYKSRTKSEADEPGNHNFMI